MGKEPVGRGVLLSDPGHPGEHREGRREARYPVHAADPRHPRPVRLREPQAESAD